MVTMITVKDSRGNIVLATPETAQNFGWQPVDASGQPIQQQRTGGTFLGSQSSDVVALAIKQGGFQTDTASVGIYTPQPKTEQTQETTSTIKKIGETPGGGIILQTTSGSGIVTTQTVPPKKWQKMREQYIATQTPEEREQRRLETVRKITSQPVVKIGGKEMTMQEWKTFDDTAVKRASDPLARLVYSATKPLSIIPASAISAIADIGQTIRTGKPSRDALGALTSSWNEEQINIQKRLMLDPGSGIGIGIERSIEPLMLGLGPTVATILPSVPIIGTSAYLTTAHGITAISSVVVGLGAIEFAKNVPLAFDFENTSAERGKALEGAGLGVVGMAVGAYGVQKGWEAMFPKISIKYLGGGTTRTQYFPDEKRMLSVTNREYNLKINDKVYRGVSISEGYGDIKQVNTGNFGLDLKGVEGYGKTYIKIANVETGTEQSARAIFRTISFPDSTKTLRGVTVYNQGTFNIKTFADMNIDDIVMAKGGINLALLEPGSKAVVHQTNILVTSPEGIPYDTVTAVTGPKKLVMGIERTLHEVNIFHGGPGEGYTVIDSGSSVKQMKALDAGITALDAGSKITTEKLTFKLAENLVNIPSIKAYVGATAKTKTDTTTISKLNTLPDLDTTVSTKTKTTFSTKRKGLSSLEGLKLISTQRIRQIQEPVVLTRSSSLSASRLDQGISTATKLETAVSVGTGSFPGISIPNIVFPPIPWGGGGTSGTFRRRGRSKRTKKYMPRLRYSPSLEAVFKGITGEIPSNITGLELRPIPIRRKAKKRTKRKYKKSKIKSKRKRGRKK